MDLTRKARWVLDGHKTLDPIGKTYAGVVSRESVHIALTYAALNDLDVFAANIWNAYLQAPSSQNDYIVCGPEFGVENIGRTALIHNLKAKDNFKLHGMTPHTATLAEEGNISSLCQFGWYEWCYYHEQTTAFPCNCEVLGQILGPAQGKGNEMAQ